ncbi:MAG: hypothetical protein ABJA11_04815 [Pseudolysinimonas sp.]
MLATLSLAGCALLGIASPGHYDHVDGLANKLDLSSVGTVQYQGHYGLGWQADIPTFIAIVSGPDVSTRVSSELSDQGLKPLGAEADSRTLWSKGDGNDHYLVVVREVKPGDEVLVGKQLIRVNESGIAISIE